MTKLKTILIAGTAAVALGTAPAMAGLLDGGASGSGKADADVGVGTSGLKAGAETGADTQMKTPDVNGSASGQAGARGNVDTPSASGTAVDAAAGATGKMKNSAEAGAEMGADAAGSALRMSSNLEAQLKERGYTAIERTDDKAEADGEAEFSATNQDGEDVNLVVNARTGAVVDEQPAS